MTLEHGGWANLQDVLSALRLTREEIAYVVANCAKQRFSYDESGTKIRANQGHSISIDLDLSEAIPPETLYHGTTDKYLDGIMQSGIEKMRRHHVHLSVDMETAYNVGSRHGKPMILAVNAKKMHADGCKFYVSANGVWLTDKVPTCYLSIV